MKLEMDKNWNKRYRDNMDKMKSGDIYRNCRCCKKLKL